MKIKRKFNWEPLKMAVLTGLTWVIFVLLGILALVSGIGIYKVLDRPPDKIKQIVQDVDPAPLETISQTWLDDTDMFLKALLTQENGPIENRWCITKGFVTDACEYLDIPTSSIHLENSQHVAVIVRAYMLRYGATNDHHAAAIFNGGPSGYYKAKAQEYAARVCNLIQVYRSGPPPVSLNEMAKEGE